MPLTRLAAAAGVVAVLAGTTSSTFADDSQRLVELGAGISALQFTSRTCTFDADAISALQQIDSTYYSQLHARWTKFKSASLAKSSLFTPNGLTTDCSALAWAVAAAVKATQYLPDTITSADLEAAADVRPSDQLADVLSKDGGSASGAAASVEEDDHIDEGGDEAEEPTPNTRPPTAAPSDPSHPSFRETVNFIFTGDMGSSEWTSSTLSANDMTVRIVDADEANCTVNLEIFAQGTMASLGAMAVFSEVAPNETNTTADGTFLRRSTLNLNDVATYNVIAQGLSQRIAFTGISGMNTETYSLGGVKGHDRTITCSQNCAIPIPTNIDRDRLDKAVEYLFANYCQPAKMPF